MENLPVHLSSNGVQKVNVLQQPVQRQQLVMGRKLNLCELNMNVISRFSTWVKHELHEQNLTVSLVILSEKITDFSVISHKVAKITGFEHE